MKNILEKIKIFVRAHKIWSIVILIIIVFLGYKLYGQIAGDTSANKYVLGAVQKGTIVASVSASGQVESGDQIDLKAKVTSDVRYIGVKAGASVRRGQTLFSFDARDAQKSVRDAETNLETAKLELEKLREIPDDIDVLSIKQAIKDAETDKTDAADDVSAAWRKLLNTSVVADPVNANSSYTAPTVTGTYILDKEMDININVYQTGEGAYYNAYSTPSGVFTFSGQVSTSVAQVLGNTGLYIKFSSSSASQPAWIISLPNKSVTAYETNLKSYQDTLDEQKKVDDASALTIAQKNQELDELYSPDPLDVRTKELAIKKAEDDLTDAKAKLSDYYVYAPFDGVMANIDAKVGESPSSPLGSIITNNKVAVLSMNEVDVAKINLGQSATMTFDAIDGLSLTGRVVEIDQQGTVSQGVVSYSVKIAFDTDDAQIKPGMSVEAAIITESKTDVLYIPASAIKTRNNTSYVEVFEPALTVTEAESIAGIESEEKPVQIDVVVGITDDTNTEIISGLSEGQQIVTRTVSATAAKTTTAPSLIGGSSSRGLGGR